MEWAFEKIIAHFCTPGPLIHMYCNNMHFPHQPSHSVSSHTFCWQLQKQFLVTHWQDMHSLTKLNSVKKIGDLSAFFTFPYQGKHLASGHILQAFFFLFLFQSCLVSSCRPSTFPVLWWIIQVNEQWTETCGQCSRTCPLKLCTNCLEIRLGLWILGAYNVR